jgi:hypothetical protein
MCAKIVKKIVLPYCWKIITKFGSVSDTKLLVLKSSN